MKKKIIIACIALVILGSLSFACYKLFIDDNKNGNITDSTTTTEKTTTTEEFDIPVENTIIKGVNKTLYIFYGDGCPHCAALHKYIENLKEEAEYKNKFNIIYYEVWNSPSNSDLVTKVKDYTGLKATGVPVYIIGDKIMYGYSKTREKEIEATIKHELENSNYKDVVEIVKNK